MSDTAFDFQATQTHWAELLLRSLFEAGVRNVVLSPGSRSTPLVAALRKVHGFSVQVVLDERSAGFFALGQAKQLGTPALLLCTSGSALAHYAPSVVEADESATPLLILSADRPLELQGNGAPQTIEQLHFFGRKVRAFFDLGLAESNLDGELGLRRKAAQAVAIALAPTPGPVHLNFPARKPLEPESVPQPPTSARLSKESALRFYPADAVPSEAALQHAAQVLASCRRPVLVVGPMSPFEALRPESIRMFLERTRWPLIAEAASQARGLGQSESLPSQVNDQEICIWDAADLLLRTTGSDPNYIPDGVLQLGRPVTSSAVARALRNSRRVVVSRSGWPDPTNRALAVVHGDGSQFLERLAPRLPVAPAAWLTQVRRANEVAWEVVREHPPASDSAAVPRFDHEGAAVTTLADELHAEDLLVLGNSLAIRLVDTFVPAERMPRRCLSQRGANGIDGFLSSAAGASLHHDGHSWALIGDLTFLHDVGALKTIAELDPRLGIIVLNNRGGRIFEQLPIARRDREEPLDLWTTPHDLPLYRIAAAFGVPSYRVGTPSELELALRRSRERAGASLIEVLVRESGAVFTYQQLEAALSDRLEPGLAIR